MAADIQCHLDFCQLVLVPLVALIIGAVAGYFGGWVDNLLMRAMDVLSAIPGMLLSIIVAAALGTAYHDTVIAMAIGKCCSTFTYTPSSDTKYKR